MEGLSLSIHVYFLLDDPFEKLLNSVGFDLCGTCSSMLYSVLASFLRNALKTTAPNFSKSAVILMYIRFRSSTLLTAGFVVQKIFRQMQKCNLFLFVRLFVFKTSKDC